MICDKTMNKYQWAKIVMLQLKQQELRNKDAPGYFFSSRTEQTA